MASAGGEWEGDDTYTHTHTNTCTYANANTRTSTIIDTPTNTNTTAVQVFELYASVDDGEGKREMGEEDAKAFVRDVLRTNKQPFDDAKVLGEAQVK